MGDTMKKDTEQEVVEVKEEEQKGYQDEYTGIGGSYLYDPITKTRTPIIEKE